MSLRGFTTVAVILAILQAVAAQTCGAPTTRVVRNLKDSPAGQVVTITGLNGVTGASLTGQNSSNNLDASLYVKMSFKSDSLIFTALPTIVGISDWPNPKNIKLNGKCNVTCGQESATVDVLFPITDANTATPQLSKPSYSLTVVENYPTGVPLTLLNISATDADQDTNNNRLTFSVSNSNFSLTPPVMNRVNPATYSTNLVLVKSLDFAIKSSYVFTVTVQDPGKLSSKSEITINVKDVDNRQPEFSEQFYTASLLDAKALGPVAVKPSAIHATDPDTGGPLKYSLVTSDAVWNQYLKLDPDNGILRLVKEIPDSQAVPEELSFTVMAKESAGPFSCQTTLRIQMKSAPGTIDNTNATGYIVGLAVLAVLLVVAIIAAALIVRRTRNRYQNSNQGNSDRQALVYNSEDPARSKPNTLAVFSYEGEPSQKSGQMTESLQSAQHKPPTIEQAQTKQTSIQDSVDKLTSELQPMRKHPEFRPPTPPPSRSKTSSISSTLPPITETDSAPASPTQPISSDSPDEPTPDYSLKSVGFKDTVECVTIEGVKDEELQDEKEAEDVEELMQANLDEAELASEDGEEEEGKSETKHDEHGDDEEAATGKDEREALDQDAEDPAREIDAGDIQCATEEGKEVASEEGTAEDPIGVMKSVEVELTGDEDEETTVM